MTASVAVAPFTITDLGVHDEAIWAFTMAEIRMRVALPTDPNLLPLGHYLLFAMLDGIPSNGVVVRVTASE